MSFLFKSTKKGGTGPNPAPLSSIASRDLRSSDGSISQVSSVNGKSASPTPGALSNLNSAANSTTSADRSGATSRTGEEGRPSISRDDNARSAAAPSPEQKTLRDPTQTAMMRPNAARQDGPTLQQQPDQMQLMQQQQQRMAPPRPSGDSSPYPWSQRRMAFSAASSSPFPRYGAAVNTVASKDGSIYLMGGLINGSTVKGDLWMVEAGPGTMSCFPVATTSEGPGPRVGHASLLVGNAFIVFGGDTKMDEGDMLDDTLYLLNTSTKQWSRALPAGPRPPGRYGHTLNILGSKIYVFGGQVEGYFFNDLVAFDLNALQQPSNRWEILIQNTIDGGPPHGQIPPARTNHTMVTWGDRLYLFGGTDGVHWFNDVWSYSPHTNSWTQLDCIGYIPSPREGHAAALVGDVMYIFGGRTEEGTDLGDLAAFRISSRRWYTFQNMGPSPSPRSGHSMTTVGKQIVVLAGEPSSAPRDPVELGLAYFLDTNKIRYPADSTPAPGANSLQTGRRPSGENVTRAGMNNRSAQQPQSMIPERSGSAAENRVRSPENGSRLPRAAQGQLPAPTGPPPQAPGQQPRANGAGSANGSRPPTRTPDRALSPAGENSRPGQFTGANIITGQPAANSLSSPTSQTGSTSILQKPETYQPSSEASGDRGLTRNPSTRSELDAFEDGIRRPTDSADPLSKVRKISEEVERPQDSGLGSSPAMSQQYDLMSRELEQVRQKNAWYASELALARKSGYQSRDSPVLDERSVEGFNDDDRPLVEALLKMRAELSRVQETIDEQAKNAAERIAEMEKQRDAAINEAVFAKARLAGQGGSGSPRPDGDAAARTGDRSDDISRRLAASLAAHAELTRQYESLSQQVEAEKRARELAEDTADAAQKRVSELDVYRQQHAMEVEGLRAELHETQKDAREAVATHAELTSKHKMLTVDHEELNNKFAAAVAASTNHTSILASLKDALAASTDKATLLEQKLEEERKSKAELEGQLRELRVEHEQRAAELQSKHAELKDAQELAQRHAEEARTHRAAVLAGLGQVTERDAHASMINDQRIGVLQEQVETANALARQNQAAADAASEKLRRAEERIAGLEAYQEQASREGLSIRKQLQATMKENHALTTDKAALEQRLERHKLETNALSVQHASLKDILGERGVNASEVRRSRAIDSPSSARFSTPDPHRFREMEQNHEAMLKSHDELRAQYDDVSERNEKMKRDYEEKLTALDNDHQAAVKYLRGTEKMLSKLKSELQRVKTENGELKKRVDKARGDETASPAVSAETDKLKSELAVVQENLKTSVAELEGRIATMQTQLSSKETEMESVKSQHIASKKELDDLKTSHAQHKSEFERLQKENSLLEERAKDAENKVQLLLDQVEHSVDNYRRQSRLSATGAGGAHSQANGHARNVSDASSSATTGPNRGGLHSRVSSLADGDDDDGESTYDDAHDDPARISDPARNSLALDSLASELETLRTHWETTKNYRLSDRFDFDRPSGSTSAAGGTGAGGWRSAVGHQHSGKDDDESTDAGTVRGENSSGRPSVEETHGHQQQHSEATSTQAGATWMEPKPVASTAPAGMI